MARSIFPNPENSSLVSVTSKKIKSQLAIDEVRQGGSQEQGYLDRVNNYIPSEVVAFFIFVNSLVGAKVIDSNGQVLIDGWVAIFAILVSIVACIIFVRSTAKSEKNPVWGLQAVVSIIALIIWSYAIEAKYLVVLGVEVVPSVSGLILASFTMLSGFLVPKLPATNSPTA